MKLGLKKSKKCPKILQLVSRRSKSRQAGPKQSSQGVLVPGEDLANPNPRATKDQGSLRSTGGRWDAKLTPLNGIQLVNPINGRAGRLLGDLIYSNLLIFHKGKRLLRAENTIRPCSWSKARLRATLWPESPKLVPSLPITSVSGHLCFFLPSPTFLTISFICIFLFSLFRRN